jgi:cysteine/O-acetylserine efflux protein
MVELILPFLSYAVVTTFTPGPNNISALAIGTRVGYKRTLPYLLGICLGFFIILFASGILTDFFIKNYAVISPWLKWIGVAYMSWLAISLYLPHASTGVTEVREGTFLSGLLLQFVNPKGILYGITIYTSFSILIANSFPTVLISAVLLTLLGFTSISLWAKTGVALQKVMVNEKGRLVFNLAMTAMLAWCAWSIAAH